MYCSFNIRRFLKYIAFDVAIILAALTVLRFGKIRFTYANQTDGILLPVLMYHSIAELPETDFCVTPDTLKNDLQFLKENGYETVSAEMLIQYTLGNGTLPAKPVMLTFDDGLYNNLSTALPILEAYQMCAVFSIVGIFTDVYAPDAPHNPNYSYLTWSDIQQCVSSGIIELGNHTYDMHCNQNSSRKGCSIMPGESEETYHNILYHDTILLQNRFQEQLHMLPVIFTYPYGFVSKESIPVLKKLGFQMTLTCLEQPNYITNNPECLFGIGRYNRPGNCSTSDFMKRVLP